MDLQTAAEQFRSWVATPSAAHVPEAALLRTLIDDPVYKDVLHEVLRSALRARPREMSTEDGVPTSAGVVIWRSGATENDELEILLVHPTSAKWAGTYSIPKGHADPDDGGWDRTAVREVREEVGIDLSTRDLVFGGVIENTDAKGRPKKRVRYFFTQAPPGLPAVIDKGQLQLDEVDWAGFVPVSKAPVKLTKYQQPLLAALGAHLAAHRRRRREAIVAPAATTRGTEGINARQSDVIRQLFTRLREEGFHAVGAWREPEAPGGLGRIIVLAQNVQADAVGSWVIPERADAIAIPAVMTPPFGSVVYDLSVLEAFAVPVVQEVSPTQFSASPSSRAPRSAPRPQRPGEPPAGWHVEAGAKLEALREATTAWLAELGFVGYTAVPVVLLEVQRVGPITEDWTRDVPPGLGGGDVDTRVFQTIVKGRPDGKLDVTSSFTFQGGKLVRRKATVVNGPDALTPEVLFPEDWLMQAAEQVSQRAANPLERLSVSGEEAFCPPAEGYVTARGATREENPGRESEDTFTTRVKLAAWREAAEQGKAILQKHGVVLGEALGCGRYACAFTVEGKPHLVAKLTGDPSEAAAWTLAMDTYGDADGTEWPATLARTYCIEALPVRVPRKRPGVQRQPRRYDPYAAPVHKGPLRYDDARRLYLVLQERLHPLAPKQKRALNDESYNVRLAAGVIRPQHGWPGPKPEVGLTHLHEYLDKRKIDRKPFDALVDLIRDLDETAGILFSDVHGGNFLRDEAGTIKLIDLGASTVPSVDVPELAPQGVQVERLLTAVRIGDEALVAPDALVYPRTRPPVAAAFRISGKDDGRGFDAPPVAKVAKKVGITEDDLARIVDFEFTRFASWDRDQIQERNDYGGITQDLSALIANYGLDVIKQRYRDIYAWVESGVPLPDATLRFLDKVGTPRERVLYRGVQSKKSFALGEQVNVVGSGTTHHSWTPNIHAARTFAHSYPNQHGYVLRGRYTAVDLFDIPILRYMNIQRTGAREEYILKGNESGEVVEVHPKGTFLALVEADKTFAKKHKVNRFDVGRRITWTAPMYAESHTEALLTPWRDRASKAASWAAGKVSDLAQRNVEGMADALADPEFMAFLGLVLTAEGASGGAATPVTGTAAVIELYRYWLRKKAREAAAKAPGAPPRASAGARLLDQGARHGVRLLAPPARIPQAPPERVEKCPWRRGTDIKTYMLDEHDEIRELLAAVEAALTEGDEAEVDHRWRQLVVDVEQHFLSEERDIFPILRSEGFETDDLEAEHAPIRVALGKRPATKGVKALRKLLEGHAEREEERFGYR